MCQVNIGYAPSCFQLSWWFQVNGMGYPTGIPILLQNQRWKQQNSKKLFKINNKDNRMTSTTSLWCLYYLLRLSIVFINFKQVSHCSAVSIVRFEHVNSHHNVIHVFFIQAKVKQHHEAELWQFKNYSRSLSSLSSKNNNTF